MKKAFDTIKNTPPLKAAITIFLVLLILELTVFQYRFFTPMLSGSQSVYIPIEHCTVTSEEYCDKYKLPDTGVQIFSIEPVHDLDGTYELNAVWCDEGNVYKPVYGDIKSMHTFTDNANVYYMYTQGTATDVAVNISYNAPCDLNGFLINSPPYAFNVIRLSILFIVVYFIRFLFNTAVLRQPSDSGCRKAMRTVCTVYCIFCTLVFFMSPLSTDSFMSDVISKEPQTNDPYMMQTHAFLNGKAELDIIPSDSLLNAVNPYDPSQRTEGEYMWDFAFYNGKYYSYFGVVPVVLLLLPFRLLTGVYLSSHVASFLFIIGSIISLTELYKAIIKKYFPLLSPLVCGCGLAVTLFGSNLMFICARAWFYEIAYASGLMFVFISLILTVKATDGHSVSPKLIGSGACLALSVGCRPVYLLTFILHIPFIIQIIKDNGRTKKTLSYAVSYASPVCLIGVLLGIYNLIRFDSFAQFGAIYQLTVSDVSYNTVRSLPPAVQGMARYLVQSVKIDGYFPFIHSGNHQFADLTYTMYSNPVTGILCYPAVWFVGTVKELKKHKQLFFLSLLLILCASVTLFSVCISAGVMERYTLDWHWTVFLAAALCGLAACRSDNRFVVNCFLCATLVTVLICCCIGLQGEFSFYKRYIEIYGILSDAFQIIP